MANAAKVEVDTLQAVCIGMIEYMEKANDIFQSILAQEANMELRWKAFCQNKKQEKEVSLPELREIVSTLGDDQIIEAEVWVR